MQPRKPCLKALCSESDPLPFASCPKVLLSPHVHFPPTPTLTSTHIADSPRIYDRAPIAISQNLCALPERGDRTYAPVSENRNHARVKGSYFHPSAYEACEPEPSGAHTTIPPPPPLTPDASSESDDSDGSVVLPEPNAVIPPISVHLAHHPQQFPISHPHSQEKLDNALSFLPHPPSPVRDKAKGRRRRSLSRPRQSNGAFGEPVLDGCLGGF